MSRFTFIHAADLHLDSPYEGLGRVEPGVAEVLRDASLAAWDALVDLCLAEDADFLVLAGDIYDGEVRGVRAQLRFVRGLERLSERGKPVFIVHGNHDPDGGRWSAIREWPPGVTVFGSDRVAAVAATRDGKRLATVHGTSHKTRAVTDNLALGFSRGPEDGLHIGVLHCSVGRDPDHPIYSPCTVGDLRRARLDYWALGHIHAHRIVSERDPVAVYSGTLQGRSHRPGEQQTKGAVVVTAEGGRVVETRFAPVLNVRFADVVVDAASVPDLAALPSRLDAAVAAELARAPASGLVLRLRLVGRGRLHADLRAPRAAAELLDALREEAASKVPFTWWSGISDETRPAIDLEAIKKRGDFPAELLRLNETLKGDPEALAGFVAAETEDLRAPSLLRWTSAIEGDVGALVNEAESLAVDNLEARSGR